MPNKIYIVAGERNVLSSQNLGGLWANVGQTTRDVSNRLQDDDYKRKAAGGKWKILFEQDVPDGFTDHQIHPFLKQHPGVSWDRESNNTEEFLFKGDLGDGSLARQIVDGILRKICLPLLQEESSKLRKEVERLQAELEQAGNAIRDLASGEMISVALMRIKELESQNDTFATCLRAAAERVGPTTEEMEALRSELRDSRESELMYNETGELESAPVTARRWGDGPPSRPITSVARRAPNFTPPHPSPVAEPSRMWPAFLVMGLVAGLLGMMVGRNNGSEWEETFKNHTPTSLLEAKGATEQRVKDLELQNQARLDRLADALVGLEEWRSRGLPQSKLQVYGEMYQVLGKDAADEYARDNTPTKAPQTQRARRTTTTTSRAQPTPPVPASTVDEPLPPLKDLGTSPSLIASSPATQIKAPVRLEHSYCITLDVGHSQQRDEVECDAPNGYGGAVIINVKGDGIGATCGANRKIIFEIVGSHVVATCPFKALGGAVYNPYRGVVTITP